jgi:hypothetical protein
MIFEFLVYSCTAISNITILETVCMYLEKQTPPVFVTSHNVTFNRINRPLIVYSLMAEARKIYKLYSDVYTVQALLKIIVHIDMLKMCKRVNLHSIYVHMINEHIHVPTKSP